MSHCSKDEKSAKEEIQRMPKSNHNAAHYFIETHLEAGRGEAIAFIEAASGKRISYSTLSANSSKVAGALTRAGIKREERAAILMLDSIDYVEVFWGCLKAGVIAVPINTLLAGAVYDTILSDSRASCLFVSAALLQVVEPVLAKNDHIRKVIVVGDHPLEDGFESYQTFTKGAPEQAAVAVSPDETAFWLYSSGSTGQPKGVRHVHSSLQATSDTYGAKILGLVQNDIVFSAAKLFFAYGLGNAMTFPMAVGATTILFDGRPTPTAVMEIFTGDPAPTIFCGVPTLFGAMLVHCDSTEQPAHQLRLCISAGEALPEEIGKKWEQKFGTEILDGVGSTEMLHIFLSNRPGDVVYGTSGVAVPGYELRLVDEVNKDVGVGEIGELLVCGDSAAEGYWNQRAKSRATFEGRWTRTGDKYEINAEGRYIYCGRTDDMFKVSGIWVSPFEVEQALLTHPAILEAAVVAAIDDEKLLKPKAYIVLQERANSDGLEDSIKAHVKDQVGKWKYPRWIEVMEELPKTATGKIQRFKLRAQS